MWHRKQTQEISSSQKSIVFGYIVLVFVCWCAFALAVCTREVTVRMSSGMFIVWFAHAGVCVDRFVVCVRGE